MVVGSGAEQPSWKARAKLDGLAGRVRTLALPDQFLPHGKAADILKEHGLDAAGVARGVYTAVRGGVPAENP